MSSDGWFDFDGDGRSSAAEEYFAYKTFRKTSGGGHSSAFHYGRAKSHPAALPEQKPIETLTREECLKEIVNTKSGIPVRGGVFYFSHTAFTISHNISSHISTAGMA